jgi:hypothetical protein
MGWRRGAARRPAEKEAQTKLVMEMDLSIIAFLV